MILSILTLLAKIFGGLILVLVAMATFSHFRAKAKVARLVAQGMYDYPGNDTFFAGSVGDVAGYMQMTNDKKERVFPQAYRWICDHIDNGKER